MSDIRANLTIDGELTGSLSIGSVHQDMVDRIEEVEARMSSAEADIDARMSAAEDKLDAAEASVEARMSAVEDDIDARMSAVEDSIQDAILNSLPEIVESRTDYFGYDHPTLQDRLTSDFDKINAKIAAYGYIPYEGTSIYATNTMEGSVNNTTIKGRTLQNVIHKDTFKNSTVYHTFETDLCVLDGNYIKMTANGTYVNAWTRKTDLIKPSTLYTMILEIKENTLVSDETNPFVLASNYPNECFKNIRYVNAGVTGIQVFKLESKENFDEVTLLLRSFVSTPATEGHITFRYMILEGDHTQTPLEELPFIEDIESVGDNHEGYKISGKSIGKNLFNINSSEKAADTVEATVEIEGDTLTLTQSYEGLWRFYGIKLNNLKINTTYTCSATIIGDLDGSRVRIFDAKEYKEISNFRANVGKCTFTTSTNNIDSLWIYFYTSYNKSMPAGTVAIFKDVLFEEGDTKTKYESYQESTYEYILDEPLRSLPNGVCDEIDLETGVLTRRIRKVVIDGSVRPLLNRNNENYSQFVSYMVVFNETNKPVNVSTNDNIICDTKPAKHQENGNNSVWIYDGSTMVFQMPSNINSQELMQQWLNSNPTTIYYELETPTTEQITPQRLKSFDGITHVVSDNKIMPYISTTVPTDISLLIESMIQDNAMLSNEVYDLRRSGEELLNEINELEEENLDNMEVSLDQEVRLTMLEMGV